jgi:hypothetical protein
MKPITCVVSLMTVTFMGLRGLVDDPHVAKLLMGMCGLVDDPHVAKLLKGLCGLVNDPHVAKLLMGLCGLVDDPHVASRPRARALLAAPLLPGASSFVLHPPPFAVD